ncbi:uncharacterized protein TRUGW13939_00663 [Talaromyces rugulosus]|uniref:Zn(2)-C6 fungal-type domain-containing protein n=1 Tax=Talaromyces rugulosus TaxID=121627 RepID=A0A7H8QHY0_TALRU|nr:uncharacterized protein TRUGW13939_00663 [Talaromyces rugulosus]QKX53584.1 hypothetical protein TRUGW13939_00663 [Talaromyces rugulosus]
MSNTSFHPVPSSSSSPSSSTPPTSATAAGKRPYRRTRPHTRSLSGCYTCRLRRKKCDEYHPFCRNCSSLSVPCEYERPVWWSSTNQRKMHKESVKEKIKQTKLEEKSRILAGQNRRHNFALPSPALNADFSRPFVTESGDQFGSQLPTPSVPPQLANYEVDVRTDHQLFVNDVPARHDTSFSTFNTFAPPDFPPTLPSFPQHELFPQLVEAGPSNAGYTLGTYAPPEPHPTLLMQMSIPVEDADRPLLGHFVDNVLRQIFPILEVNQKGLERAQAILHSLESNKSYLHCCLSVAATHLKTSVGMVGDDVDHNIMKHRFEAVTQLCQALKEDKEHEQILEATLAMILFQCAVGAVDEYLPDVAWSDHFHAAVNLVNKLELPSTFVQRNTTFVQPPFNMTLTSWIDILGATMLGRTPKYAHAYRSNHLSGTPAGLRELMGCDDRVMYLISEIACLDALKSEGVIDDLAVCSHVTALGSQLEYTEPFDHELEHPYSPFSGIRPDQLTKNITTIYRFAARIYLCSLVPGFDRTQSSNVNLVEAVTNALQFIPSGPDGFDRSLVWPLLITGAHSTPHCSFRQVLHNRTTEMGEESEFGSYGRMLRVLEEVWRLSDDSSSANESLTSPTYPVDYPVDYHGNLFPPTGIVPPTGLVSPEGMPGRRGAVHWRDVMIQNGWKYLLI